MTELALRDDDVELGSVRNVVIRRTGLEVLASATDEDYGRIDELLDTVGGSALWWWGDYLNHLASARGVEYAEAKAASGYSPSALRTASWVCRHVDRSRRRDLPLRFSHHQEVASMTPTEQEIWLARAEENKWTSKQLRAEIRLGKATHANGREQSPVDPRAARASAAYEVFSIWWQAESPGFSDEQWAEWHRAIEPLAADYVSRVSDADLARMLAARASLKD